MKKTTNDWLISAESDLLLIQLGLLPNGRPSISEAKEFYILGRQLFKAAKATCK